MSVSKDDPSHSIHNKANPLGRKTEDPSAKTIHQQKVGIDDLRDGNSRPKDNNGNLDLLDDNNDLRDNNADLRDDNADLRDNDPPLGHRLQQESGAYDSLSNTRSSSSSSSSSGMCTKNKKGKPVLPYKLCVMIWDRIRANNL
eukprot:jgi/Psemu1/29508/gm1.29508_g